MPEIRRGVVRAKALGGTTRLSIAVTLRERAQAMYVDQLAAEIGRDQSLVSRHCQKLAQAGLCRRYVAFGLAHYELTDEGLALVDAVMKHQSSSR